MCLKLKLVVTNTAVQVHTHTQTQRWEMTEQFHFRTITCCYHCFRVATWYFPGTLPGTFCDGVLLQLCDFASERSARWCKCIHRKLLFVLLWNGNIDGCNLDIWIPPCWTSRKYCGLQTHSIVTSTAGLSRSGVCRHYMCNLTFCSLQVCGKVTVK